MFIRSCSWVVLWLCFVTAAIADDIVLAGQGEDWRFFKGTMEPSTVPGDWTQVDFDDSQWLLGMPGFGFGGDDVTVLPDMGTGYSSLYLRKSFQCNSPEGAGWLMLRLDYQDGVVVYLNGVEVLRQSVLGTAGEYVPYNAVSSFHMAGVSEEFDLSSWRTLLRPGTNTLAIQGSASSSLIYGYSLVPELRANISRGPLIMNTSSNSSHLAWKTVVPAICVVEYGPSLESLLKWQEPAADTNHTAILTNLDPGTLYYYRISISDGVLTATTPFYHFKTFAMSGDFDFLVAADTGLGTSGQNRIARVMESQEVDMLMLAGDVIYPTFVAGRVDERCFSMYGRQLRSTPLFAATGNHESYDNTRDFLQAFDLPTNSLTGTEYFYSFDAADIHFSVLDGDLAQGNDWSVGGALYRWLEADLAATTKPWKILVSHFPVRSSGPHRNDDYNGNGMLDRLEFQNSIEFLAGKYGVQAIFNGHEHFFEKMNPVNGVQTFISGGGGGWLYAFGGEWDVASSLLISDYECLRVSVRKDDLVVRVLGVNGQILDSTFISRVPAGEAIRQAAWNTPVVETIPANDGDGNIAGQLFDFIGQPIPSLTGQFSNLGLLYVNNDEQTLYLGLSETMFYKTNTVFLFVEVPHVPGRENLAPPVNSGANDPLRIKIGLDYLANLSFTNFKPSIGCILGDEYGDGQFRVFDRTGHGFNEGQGVFYLDSQFSTVPDCRLQQYHSSPQGGPGPGIANAGFIELAIPFQSLGGLRPVDLVKIAVIVAGEPVDTNGNTRWIDSGYVGVKMEGSGIDSVVLEGVPVQLAIKSGFDTTDSDLDGLPDYWEQMYGLDPHSAGSDQGTGGDPDHDGLSNFFEFRLGTDPLTWTAKPQLSIGTISEGRIQLEWDAEPGGLYQIEVSDTLSGPYRLWETPALPTRATSCREKRQIPISGGSNMFFRIGWKSN